MTIRDFIISEFPDQELLFADGFDNAVIGVDHASQRLIYSIDLCMEILVQEGMTMEDALEHLEFNVINAYVGEKTPIWCQDINWL